MADEVLTRTVQSCSELPSERLHVVDRLSDLKLDQVTRGILFICATWSPPAVAALQKVTRILRSLGPSGLKLIVIDNDCMTAEDMLRLFGHVVHGYGETFWIKDGCLVAEAVASRPEAESLITKNTLALLGETAA